jgi:hypothetical protein
VTNRGFDPRGSVVEFGGTVPLSCRFMRSIACLLLLACVGCRSISSSQSIDQLHLLVTSVALNLDGKPGADGVGVRLYASHRGNAAALPITSGTLDILMFEGNLPFEELPQHKPRHTWSYPAAKLKRQLQETSVGTSYRFAALWGEDQPQSERITLVARYTAPGGQPVYSAPSSVPVSVK